MVRVVKINHDLNLCDLASPGAAVKGFGQNAAQLSTRRYTGTQALSATIAQRLGSNEQPYDGILYPSRNNPGSVCIGLFDGAAAKVSIAEDIRLDDHRDWPSFKHEFSITVVTSKRSSRRRHRPGKRPQGVTLQFALRRKHLADSHRVDIVVVMSPRRATARTSPLEQPTR